MEVAAAAMLKCDTLLHQLHAVQLKLQVTSANQQSTGCVSAVLCCCWSESDRGPAELRAEVGTLFIQDVQIQNVLHRWRWLN